MKAKVLQLENDKQQLQKKKNDLILKVEAANSGQRKEISTYELIKAMSQVSLKDVEIKHLKEKNNQVQQENKILQEKVSKQKIKLRRQLPLQGEKHFL